MRLSERKSAGQVSLRAFHAGCLVLVLVAAILVFSCSRDNMVPPEKGIAEKKPGLLENPVVADDFAACRFHAAGLD